MKKSNSNEYFVPTYARTNPPIVKGKGMYVWDSKGKKYLDFSSGIAVNALGHGHPEMIKALKDQGTKLLHVSNLFHVQPQIDLAKLLVKHSFGDKVFFCNSGTEANEAAIKFSRKWAGTISKKKYNVLSFYEGFHGRTYGALSATAQQKFHAGFGPMMKGFYYAEYNNTTDAKKILDKHEFAAIIVEPLQGESGINAATTRFLKFLRTYANKHKIALIFDEVQCGIGRTGSLWNYEQHGVKPDIMTLAKPLGGGLPLGAVVCSKKISNEIKPGEHGTTFGGNPLACALGTVVLKTVSKKSFLRSVNSTGTYLKNKLQKIAESNDSITAVLGSGLMVGVRMKEDPKDIIAACKNNGLLVIKAANNTVRFMPPLIAKKTDVDKAVKLFSKIAAS
ncbi:MAG: acetylornithine/succinylornithine family transaminase [Chitinivibrionales bacterium]|nr:acetylornithine/succinylornithine family transaminase [Chitinivibrionales bacterium]